MATATDSLYTADNYATVRKSWQDLVEMFGLTQYNAKPLAKAYQLWADNAPEYAGGDDWTAAADDWHRTYLANRTQ